MGGFLKGGGADGCFAVEGVNHYFAGLDELKSREPWKDVFGGCVVNGMTLVFALHEHGLNDAV